MGYYGSEMGRAAVRWYNDCVRLLGTSRDYLGLGDIVGVMSPFMIAALIFLIVSLILCIVGKARKRNAARAWGIILSELTICISLFWGFAWIPSTNHYFLDRTYPLVKYISVAVSAHALAILLLCLIGIGKKAKATGSVG